MADGQMSMELRRDGDVIVISGDIDISTAPLLEAEIASAAADGDVVLDMAGVHFVDSRGLSALMQGHRRAAACDRRFVVRNPSVPVVRLLSLVGLDAHLHIVVSDADPEPA